jgi:hypothetical protein
VFAGVRRLCSGCNIGVRNDGLTYSGSDAGWPTSISGAKHRAGDWPLACGPETGGVDLYCRIHGIGNFCVPGSSVFPISGQAAPRPPALIRTSMGHRTVKIFGGTDGPFGQSRLRGFG